MEKTALTAAALRKNWDRKIYYTNCPVVNALVIAYEKGWLQDRLKRKGVIVDEIPAQERGSHLTYAHAQHLRFGGEIPPLVAHADGAPTRLLALTPWTPRQGVYVRPDSPIATAADLKGKRLALSAAAKAIALNQYAALPPPQSPWERAGNALGVWEARGILHTLDRAGLRPTDLELVEIPFFFHPPLRDMIAAKSIAPRDRYRGRRNLQLEALERGEVDAMFLMGEWAAQLELEGRTRLVYDLSQERRNHFVSVLTVSAVFLEAFPEWVEEALTIIVAAGKWAATHRDETVALTAHNIGVSLEACVLAGGPEMHRTLVPGLGEESVQLLAQTAQFLHNRGIIQQKVNIDEWMEPRFVRQALVQADLEAVA